MKEYDNYLSRFYEEGTRAEDLPGSKRVYTESEMQTALSRILCKHGIFVHINDDLGE